MSVGLYMDIYYLELIIVVVASYSDKFSITILDVAEYWNHSSL